MAKGTLFVVATPIGNREDLAPRALAALEGADLIAAEDTRHTGRLLSHFGVKTPQTPLHEHNEASVVERLVDRLLQGETIALVSDAGTPLVSDPGFRLIAAAHERGIPVSPIPGPSAVLAALSVAGLPTDRFCFEGFLPPKSKARRERLTALAREPRTLVFFEAVHRIGACLADLALAFGGERNAFLGRELTKLHEQCITGSLTDLNERLAAGEIPAKGEFVLVVAGSADVATASVEIETERLLREVSRYLSDSKAVELVATVTGRRRNEIYRMMLEEKQRDDSA